uniref:Gag-Pol polyprotein n=1 Tax=Tanacetum cinerariifolium TaxID=118510 RepID=A0A699I2M2_TANCI|nr:Gag-Pol polyprotein [Tanacetum cinerariifolium]
MAVGPNGDALRKCILNGPYIPTTVVVQAVAPTDDSPVILGHTTEMWEAIERLQQGESLNIQDPEWSRFMMIVKQQHKLDEVSYHKLFDILKQYQKEVNELRAERLARNANPLALVATAQANQDPFYQTLKSQKSYAPSLKPLILSRSHMTTRYKGKEIAKLITPLSESASKEDGDPEQAQRDKGIWLSLQRMQKAKKGLKTPRITRKRCCCENKLRKEVPTADSGTNSEPLEQVQNDIGYNVSANDLQYSEQYETISNTCIVETDDSNVIPNSPNMCEDNIQNDQNDVESDDERVALANLIANLKLDVDENKKIQKQLKKANTTLAQELKECKTILAETSKTLGESNSVWDSCLVALQNKQTEFEKYKAFNDRTVDYDKLERKLNETLEQLTQKDIEIKEGLKLKAYEISVVKEKHDELIKQSFLIKSHYEGLVKRKTKVITDLKLKEENDIDKMLSMEKQLKFLNETIYKRNQAIQTIHMMAPKAKNDTVWNEQASNVFRKKREQYIEIQDLKAQLQDKNIVISELKKLIEKGKGKSTETKFDKPSVVRQPNAQQIFQNHQF